MKKKTTNGNPKNKYKGAINLFTLCKKELKNRTDLRMGKYLNSKTRKVRDTEVYNLVGLGPIAGHQWKSGRISMQSVKYLYQISTKLNIDMNTLTKIVLNSDKVISNTSEEITLLQLGGKY